MRRTQLAFCEQHLAPIRELLADLTSGEHLLVFGGLPPKAERAGDDAAIEDAWYSGRLGRQAFLLRADGPESVEKLLLGSEPRFTESGFGWLGATVAGLIALLTLGGYVVYRKEAEWWFLVGFVPVCLYGVEPSVATRFARALTRLGYRLQIVFGWLAAAILGLAGVAWISGLSVNPTTVVIVLLVTIVVQLANVQRRLK